MLRAILKVSTGVAFGLGIGLASAQSLRNADHPAEFPPSSFTAKQYVDSKGCVFVRAGFDGAVTWVPRVNRKRNVLCGFKPSLAGASPAAPAPAPRVATAPTATPPRPTAVAPTPPRQTVAATPVYTTPAVRTPPPARVAIAPVRPVRNAPRATAPRPAPTQLARIPSAPTSTGTVCPGVSALSQKYMRSSTHKVRCGPQGTAPTYGAAAGNGVSPTYAAPTYAAPANGVIRVAPAPEITPPPGYRAAFDDDRFAPNRGLGTREGHAQMRLVWTSGVPRRLVDQNTGRDVSELFPGLRFPFISFKQQKKYVAVNGWPAASMTVQPSYSVSTKNTPAPVAAAPRAVAGGHRYVQVGTFGVDANAQSSAARLKGMGLPVRVGSYQKAGKTYRIVMAGPFQSAAQLQAGLNAARRAGYSDAFTRK